ncbi:E3 ubiquitin-protein ligase lubel isoform X2 [Drosophila tropicalis]|uniref:E3 ubiquitin-protein ligase lubel isoform X2 n=1 Tax=Drosophila tropicalis TaxID=46794 RepID=UPI0035AC16C6
MTTQQLLNKNVRTMPSWVTEASQRIGPKPPPLPPNAQNGSNGAILPKAPALPPKSKDTPEPDYEVIEFSNQQQYSNEPMKTTIVRTKTPDNKLKCTLCGSQNPWVTCEECAGQIFCASCDDMFHKHPKRKQHIRKAVQQASPPIPPKVQGGPTPPVAPPRRSKRGLLTPFLGRKDQMLPPPSPTPSHKSTSAWRGGVQPPLPPHSSSSTMNNRPLPDPPRTPMSEGGGSSRSETPKSVFDTIQRPPSVQLEKIKSKANATLDRMAILQQRYRQQKAQQDLRASEQAAGNQRRQMSTSVFNLNTGNRRPLQETPQNGGNSAAWLANQRMQQAQSMAQLNCAGCQHQQQNRQMQHPEDWSQFGSQQQFNHSNLSLNVGPGYLNQQHPAHYPHPPPVFMTQRGMMPNMYPGPGYPMMHPGVMGMPPPRASSRPRYAASPTPSRKSLSMRRKRSSYVDDELTDDEDSDQDDRRSLVSNRSGMTSASRSHHHHHHQQQHPHHHQQRQRRLSSASQLINNNDDIDGNRHHQPKVRERRGSIAKSVQSEWLPERRDSTEDRGEGNETLKRSQVDPPKTSRIYSDLESEGSGARALVQAKIQQKLQEADQHKAKKAQHKHKPEMKDENTQAAAVVQKVAPQPAAKEDSASEYEEIVEEVTATESEPEQTQPSQPDNIEADAEADELGPPPSTPDHEWECEFCTFVNEANIKICSICCKTPSKPPQPTKNEVKKGSKPVPQAETPKLKEVVNQKQQPQTKVVRKPSIKSSQKPTEKIASPAKTKSSASTSTATTSTSTAKKHASPTKPALKTSSENESDNSLAKGFLHKESVENIWNTLDESIQAQAEQVLKKAQKVSTSCGGTPPREIPVEKPIVDTSREMGTSPPPQSISTQTYEALPLSPQVENPSVSNATAVRESPGKMERRPHYRSNSQLPQDHERYRSASDLRYANEGFGMDYYGNSSQVTRRPNFINDLRLLQHQASSPFDMPVEPTFNLKHEPARDPETEMHIILKELELYKFTVEELEAALKYCAPDTHPIQWLRENWHKLIQTVQSLSTKYGQERGENTIGSISQNEAREALRSSSGNVWQAVADCIQQRQQKYRRLAAKGNFLRDDIVNALTAHQGNVEQALLDLNRTQLKPFLMRIWGSPNGVENESVPAIDMKSDIHDFLNTHALDCLQMPHGAGESPSPGPAFANHPFDDNSSPSKSSYATPSPYQLEDSTLKNLEILIGNMEQNQAKQNQEVLRSIETMLETFKGSEGYEPTATAATPDVGVIETETHSDVAHEIENTTETISVEDVVDVEAEDPIKVPTPLPLTPAPPIIDSESRPMELPVETVLEEPKKVKASSPTKTSSKQKTLTTEPVASTSTQNPSTTTPKTGKSSISKIPKPTTNETPNTLNRKLPLRSKSFSAPMGISSVKRMQQEYLQKQQSIKSTAVPVALSSRVPLRSSPTAKKSITEAISRFNTQSQQDGPSTSAAAAAAALLKPRSQPRIPKKKYHETCFSDDDYETSATEEEDDIDAAEPLRAELLKRKLSMPVFRAYASLQEPVIEEPAVLARKYVEMEKVSNLAEAQIAATLVNMKFQEDVALWAAKECSDLDQAIAMLQQDCELCMNTYPMNQIVSMLKCTHKCCKQCAKTYFTVQITDRSINDCNCPYCKLPELSNEAEHEDEHLEYFSNLDIFLKSILDNDVHELFQRKLRDRSLLQDPNFKWCIQCSSGFFARPKQKRLICPDCGSVTCAQCRKPWERQHEGSTCEAYLEWRRENDPELQAQGVQEHLAQNGIDCPKCKFRYSLARGGCMHFTCTQCKFEFCYGCARPFMMGAKCNISPYCAKLGLHAHHPRNCLFYLRDKIPLQLQFLLKEQKVKFDTEAKEDVKNEPSSSRRARASAKCPIPLQKETPQGLVDTVCNSEVPDKHAGMCRTHYVEYLAGKVAKAGIDPLPIFDLTDCVQELRRRGIALPERGPWDTDEIYKNMCSEVIKQHIPLKSA